MISKCSICNGREVVLVESKPYEVWKQCECVKEEIERRKFSKLKNFSDMPENLKELKIKDFRIDVYESPKNKDLATKAKHLIINYIKKYESVKTQATGLYLYSGIKGSGKTRLVVGLGNALVDVYKERVKFCTTIKLLEEIKSTYGDSEIKTTDLLEAIKTVPVLILDDIGTEKPSSWVNEMFYDIVNQRMLNNLITIYTSNCKIGELQHDDRIKSRIAGTVLEIQCPEQDIRVKLAQEKNKELENFLLSE